MHHQSPCCQSTSAAHARLCTGAFLAQVLWQLTSLGTLASNYQVDASIDPTFTTGVVGLPQAVLQNNNTVFITTDASPAGRRCAARQNLQDEAGRLRLQVR